MTGRGNSKMDQDEDSLDILDYYNCSGEPLFINLTKTNDVTITLHAAIVGLFIGLGLIGNIAVLILVLKDKRLRHRSIIASLNIVIVDIFLTIFYHGVILTNTLSREWSYIGYTDDVEAMCRLYGTVTTFLIDVRWCTIGLLTLDRFLTVRYPFRYEKYSVIFLLLSILMSWLIPLTASGLLAVPLVGYTFRANIPTCLPSCLLADNSFCKLLNTGIIIIMFIIGCLLPLLLYLWMYWKARKLRVKYTLGQIAVTATAGIAVSNSSFNLNEKVNKDKRAMITILLIFLTIFFTSSPQFLFFLLRQISICTFFKIPIEVHFIVTDIFLLSTTLDPIVIMRNQDFRIVLYELIHGSVLCRVHHVSDQRSLSTRNKNANSGTSLQSIESNKESNKELNEESNKESTETII